MSTVAPDEPVTLWMRQLQQGEAAAAGPLWDHFCRRLTQLARGKLPRGIRGVYDEDDVANSAFHSLFAAVQQQRAASLNDRDSLWRLLVVIAERKISNRLRDERAAKRDIQRTVASACFDGPDGEGAGLDMLASREPTPDFACEVAETCDGLMSQLGDDTLREIARLRLENFTPIEIASKLNVTRRTVHRKLLEIRKVWGDKPAET